MKKNFPITIILFLSSLIGILALPHYGESWDDLSLQKYAAKSLNAYRTWPLQGEVNITKDDLGNYGPAYVMTIALGSKLLDPILQIGLPETRHLLYFITFLIGVWAFYWLGRRWLTQTAAMGATLLFMTQPLLWGHAFINPKDTPFLALFLISLYFGFKMTDLVKPFSSDSLIASAKLTLPRLTVLWLVSVFSLFLFTDTFHTLIAQLVVAAQAGKTNIISLIASDIHKVDPQVYINKYFVLFIQVRAVLFFTFTCLLIYLYYRNFPFVFNLLVTIAFPALLLGVTSSIRILGPLAGLIIVYYALRIKGRQIIPALIIYTVVALVAMYLTWPYLWADPAGHFMESVKEMSLYPWKGQVLFNGVEYASTELPYLYLPVLFGIQLTEPVWVLFIVGLVVAINT